MNPNFSDFDSDRMINDPTNYRWGIFYFNKNDSRTVVPKHYKMMGWTFNFAKINSYLIILGLISAVLISIWLG